MKSNGNDERGLVTVRNGIFAHELPVAGLTVAETRAALIERMNIQPGSTNVLDGEPAEDSTVLVEEQVLCFIRPACCKC